MEEKKNKYRPNVLVIGPGAEKGYYFLGSMLEFKEKGILDEINKIAAVSVGSIVALLFCIGYNIKEIIENLVPKSTFQILGTPKISSIISKGGVFSINGLKKLLTDLVETKLGYIPTMEALYTFSQIEMTVVVTNLNKKSYVQYINYKNDPKILCVDAVILSCSLPVIFERVIYGQESMLDGGWSDPYPINYYDDGENVILGIYINEQLYLNRMDDNITYFNNLISSRTDILRVKNMSVCSKRCFHFGITTTNKVKSHITPDKKDKYTMIMRGKRLARDFLKQLSGMEIPLFQNGISKKEELLMDKYLSSLYLKFDGKEVSKEDFIRYGKEINRSMNVFG